jgi:hypothetical protein
MNCICGLHKGQPCPTPWTCGLHTQDGGQVVEHGMPIEMLDEPATKAPISPAVVACVCLALVLYCAWRLL